MQPYKKLQKHIILEEYVKNPFQDTEKLAITLGTTINRVTTIIQNYKWEINLKLPLYIVKSIDLLDTYYLFTETEEKVVKVKDRLIINAEDFTHYEMLWLYNEKAFK
jgi:selenocysteine-specific translation elongation factor